MATEVEKVKVPLVFRDFLVLLATSETTAEIYRAMVEPMGFSKVLDVHKGQHVIPTAKKHKPDLVIASTDMKVMSGPQILAAARKEPELGELPFLIVGVKEDTRPGGLADKISNSKLTGFVGLPCDKKEFSQALVKLMSPLINPDFERACELMDQASEAVKVKKLDDAVKLYSRAGELNPGNQGAWMGLAAASAEQGDYDTAEIGFLKAIEIEPLSLMAYFGLADLYERREDYEHTVNVLTQALDLAKKLKGSDSSLSRINFFIGEFELRLNRLNKAEMAFGKAVDQNPEDAVLRSNIGDAYLEKGYLEESEQYYKDSLAIDNDQAHIFNRLGIAYRKQGKYDKALKLYDYARQYHPEDEHLIYNAARAHMDANRRLEASALLEQALEKEPEFKAAKTLLALAAHGGNWSEDDLNQLRNGDSAKLWRRNE